MIAVVDTSALVELFTVDADEQHDALAARLAEIHPHAPDIVDVEFHHALRGLVLGGKVSKVRAELARDLYLDTPIHRFPTRALVDRVWSLRHDLGAYDACFVAMAEVLDEPLITCDDKQRTARGHRATVEVF